MSETSGVFPKESFQEGSFAKGSWQLSAPISLPGREVPPQLALELAKRRGIAPINILAILTSPSSAEFFTDRELSSEVTGLPTHYPLVTQWPDMQSVESDRLPDGVVRFTNLPETFGMMDRFSAWLRTQQLEGAPVKIFQGVGGSNWPGDFVLAFDGLFDEVSEQLERELSLQLVGVGAGVDEVEIGRTALDSEFPLIPLAEVGRPIWKVFGAVDRLPLIPVDIGGDGTLVTAMTGANAPGGPGPAVVTITSEKDAEDFPAGEHRLRIGLEEMVVNRAAGTDQFTIVTRGDNASRVEDHSSGDAAFELRAAYDYAVSVDDIDSFSEIRADGILQTGIGPTLFALPDGGQGLRFPERPLTVKDLDPEVADSIAISQQQDWQDQIEVIDDVNWVSDNIGVSSNTTAAKYENVSIPYAGGSAKILSITTIADGTLVWTSQSFNLPSYTSDAEITLEFSLDWAGLVPSQVDPGDFVRLGIGLGTSFVFSEWYFDSNLKRWESNTSRVSGVSSGTQFVYLSAKIHAVETFRVRITKISQTAYPDGSVSSSKSGGAFKSTETYKQGTIIKLQDAQLSGSAFSQKLVSDVVPAQLVTAKVARGTGDGVNAWLELALGAGAVAGDTSRAASWTSGQRFDFAVAGGSLSGPVLSGLADNLACRQHWRLNGELALLPLDISPARSTVRTITPDEVLRGERFGEATVVTRTRRDELVYELTAFYSRDYRDGLPTLRRSAEAVTSEERELRSEYRASTKASRSGGVRKAELQLDFVSDSATAAWRVERWLDISSVAWSWLTVPGALDGFSVAVGDLVVVVDDSGHFTTVGAVVMEVHERRLVPGSARDGRLDRVEFRGRIIDDSIYKQTLLRTDAGAVLRETSLATKAGAINRTTVFATKAGEAYSDSTLFVTAAGKILRTTELKTTAGGVLRQTPFAGRAARYFTSGAGHTSGGGMTSGGNSPP